MTQTLGWILMIASLFWFSLAGFAEASLTSVVSNSATLIAGAILAKGGK